VIKTWFHSRPPSLFLIYAPLLQKPSWINRIILTQITLPFNHFRFFSAFSANPLQIKAIYLFAGQKAGFHGHILPCNQRNQRLNYLLTPVSWLLSFVLSLVSWVFCAASEVKPPRHLSDRASAATERDQSNAQGGWKKVLKKYQFFSIFTQKARIFTHFSYVFAHFCLTYFNSMRIWLKFSLPILTHPTAILPIPPHKPPLTPILWQSKQLTRMCYPPNPPTPAHYSLSNKNVTGPSLILLTCICSPKVPFSTVTPCSAISSISFP